ncbi:MAG: hypothetical protein HY301_02935 [Verrucomicrobia bacterium]|nr:hypothetical protein [Verrucomicrobiota bacterium]
MSELHPGQLPPRSHFFFRYLRSVGFAAVILLGALLVGVLGYHFLADLGWVDSLLNAAMILTGMGPVNPLPTTAAKLFASAYALFSGVVFITVMGVMLAPVFLRVLHKFHLDSAGRR